jgi:endonuclease/exonuclease/phosphatase family metal-dependent hydrolase
VAGRVLRVVDFNANSFLESAWPDRRREIVAWLDRLQPDVVCLQEIWQDATHPNTANEIVDQTTDAGWHWHFGGRSLASWLWPDPELLFGSAILSRWPIDSADYHALPLADEPHAPEKPFNLTMGVPWELVHVRSAGLDIFSCHLAPPPQDAHHRRRQVVTIDRHIKETRGDLDTIQGFRHARDAMPPILGGDFNAQPDSDEIRFLSGFTVLEGHTTYYQDAWRVAGEGPGYTEGDWRTNPLAASLNVPPQRIDYVFVGDSFQRKGNAGRVISAEIAFNEPITGVYASDHAGLVVDVLWPNRPA